MRRRAFTLIEVMAVVALLGLIAGAVTWSLSGRGRPQSRQSALSQLIRSDQMARLAARRQDRSFTLRFDLASQRIERLARATGTTETSTSTRLTGCRMDRVVVAGMVGQAVPQVPLSSAGRSPGYAVRLVCRDWRGWLVFCGLTGQPTLIENEREAQNLLLLAMRHDAP